jgi:dynein light chain roadblock-type
MTLTPAAGVAAPRSRSADSPAVSAAVTTVVGTSRALRFWPGSVLLSALLLLPLFCDKRGKGAQKWCALLVSQGLSFCLTRAPSSPPLSPFPQSAVEIEETIKRIASHKGVQGILVCNFEGVALKSTMPKDLTAKYAGLFAQLIVKSRSVVRTIDAEVSRCGSVVRERGFVGSHLATPVSQNDLLFLRVRTKKHEVLIAPDREFLLITVQDANGP